jgi:hypothetical protein
VIACYCTAESRGTIKPDTTTRPTTTLGRVEPINAPAPAGPRYGPLLSEDRDYLAGALRRDELLHRVHTSFTDTRRGKLFGATVLTRIP